MSLAQQQTWVAERYRLLEPLGSGGMGRVWLARDEVLRRDVAIKEIIPPDGLTEPEREELRLRTMREARAAARLNDPHVVRIYDVLQAQNRPWIVMEYVPSRSLHQVITEEGPLPSDRAAVIGIDVLAALKAAHLAGVLHRDVKPGNVLLADDGRVVLTDFGLAIFEGGDGAVTRPGLILGSPQYIAPERAREGQSGPEADLWSLGATLYAAVEGRSPYARSTTFATLTALATEDPDPPHRAGVLKPVLSALLRKDPRTRAGIAETERLLRKAANTESRFRPWALPRQRKPREIESGSSSNSGANGAIGANSANGLNGLSGSGGALAVGAPVPVESKPADNKPVTEDSEAVSQIGTTTAKPSVTFPGKVRGKATVPGAMIELGNPSPAAEPTPVHRRRRWALAGLTALLVLALLAGGLFLVDRRRGDRTQAESPPAPSASASLAATPSPTDQFGLVPGFHYYDDPTYHWRVGVPDGWQQRPGDAEHPTMVEFYEPVLPRRKVGIERITKPTPDAQAWTNADAAKAKKELSGYAVTRIIKVGGFYASAADWVYSYNTSEGRITVCERRVVIGPSLGYIIFWATPASQWRDNSENWQLLSVSFKPEPTP